MVVNGLFEEIGEMYKIRKNYKQCYYKKINIKNSVLDYIKILTVELVWPCAKNGR